MAYGIVHIFSLDLAELGITIFGDDGEALGALDKFPKR